LVEENIEFDIPKEKIEYGGDKGDKGEQGVMGMTGLGGVSQQTYFTGPSPQYNLLSTTNLNNQTFLSPTLQGAVLNGATSFTTSLTSPLITTNELVINGTTTINGGLTDSYGSLGLLGQVLSSTGTSTQWVNQTGGGGGGNIASGTTQFSTLYWDGSTWLENTTFLSDLTSSTSTGGFVVLGTTTLATTTVTSLTASSATLDNATSTTFFASLFSSPLATIYSLLSGNITATSSLTSNGTLTVAGQTTLANASTSNLTTGNLTATGTVSLATTTITSLSTTGDITANRITTTYASSTYASSTALTMTRETSGFVCALP
jgi:hypothetical protein